MSNEHTELTTKEEVFIELLIHGAPLSEAAEQAGYSKYYGHALRKRLSKHILEAAQDYMSMNALKASRRIVESIDSDKPVDPNKLNAANSLLDRVGITKKDGSQTATIQANIFILPEKKPTTAIIIDND